MHLTPREIDKLMLHQAGVLAQKRLARGLRLNYVEAVALIATQLLEFIRDGQSVADLMDLGRRILGRADVLEGVAEMIDEVQVEGTFPDGTKLVTVHHPIVAERGDRALALFGSFLAPETPADASSTGAPPSPPDGAPGERDRPRRGDRPQRRTARRSRCRSPTAAIGRSRSAATITSSRPTARWPSIAAPAYGMRLDIPAGTAVRFEPGETKTVTLVAIAGARVIRGGNALGERAGDRATGPASLSERPARTPERDAEHLT